jgi:hypothetical protein
MSTPRRITAWYSASMLPAIRDCHWAESGAPV